MAMWFVCTGLRYCCGYDHEQCEFARIGRNVVHTESSWYFTSQCLAVAMLKSVSVDMEWRRLPQGCKPALPRDPTDHTVSKVSKAASLPLLASQQCFQQPQQSCKKGIGSNVQCTA